MASKTQKYGSKPRTPLHPQAGIYNPAFDKVCVLHGRAGHKPAKGTNEHASPYIYCLTHTQVEKLFNGKPSQPIGSGATAVVFGRSPDTVVKITRDPDDVAALLRTQDMRRVVKVREAYELTNAAKITGQKDVPLYGLVVERMDPPDPSKLKLWVQGPVEDIRKPMLLEADMYQGPRERFSFDYRTRAFLPELCENLGRHYPHKNECKLFMQQFGDTWEQLYRRGIRWSDTHYGNFGQTPNGNWKIIDLGFSYITEKPKLPALNGPKPSTPKPRLVHDIQMPNLKKL